MTRRRLPIVLSALFATLVLAIPASAGGWATATMAPAPEPAAGFATTFAFDIRQHGKTPISWVSATFVATNLATGEQIQFPMRTAKDTGAYTVAVTFPDAGEWSWFVTFDQLASDQDGAGGTVTVLEPAEALVQRLSDLGIGLDEAFLLLPALARWVEAAGRSADAG